MSVFRRSIRIVPAVAGLLAVATASARADQPLFTWTGTVDREVLLVMRGRNVETRGADARLRNNARVLGDLPRNSSNGDVQVRLESGRGVVDVIEQPSARNNYQTVIRIRDPRGGADNYRISAYWTGDDRGNDGRGNGGIGNGNGNGNNRRDDGNYGRGRDDRNDGSYGRGRDDRNDRDNRPDRGGRYDPRNDRNDRNDRGGRYDPRNDRNDRNDRNGGRDDSRAGPGSLSWSGRVDDIVDITIRGGNVSYETRSGAQVDGVRSRLSGGALPRREGGVTIVSGNGRGSVLVVQQPSQSNGYTAIIRINDPRGGAGDYNFEARW
jgi:hypothetical protein